MVLWKQMLKKKYRLGSKVKVKFKNFLSTPFFLLKIAENNLVNNRYRFVISKKIDKRAVIRNKIKRILSSCIEDMFKETKTGYDMLFLAKKEISNVQRDKLCLYIKTILSEKKLIK